MRIRCYHEHPGARTRMFAAGRLWMARRVFLYQRQVYAPRNVAQEPFHLTFTYLINIFANILHVWMPPLAQGFSLNAVRTEVIGRGHVSGLDVRRLAWPRAGMEMRGPGPDHSSELATR